jgi:excisionase family DNA binding protein
MDNPFQTIIERLGSIESLLQNIQSEKEKRLTDATLRKIMSLAEFCEYTGLTKQTAYKLTSAQKVPHSKRGKRLYFDREKVDAWLLENQVATQGEIQQKANAHISKNRLRQRM